LIKSTQAVIFLFVLRQLPTNSAEKKQKMKSFFKKEGGSKNYYDKKKEDQAELVGKFQTFQLTNKVDFLS